MRVAPGLLVANRPTTWSRPRNFAGATRLVGLPDHVVMATLQYEIRGQFSVPTAWEISKVLGTSSHILGCWEFSLKMLKILFFLYIMIINEFNQALYDRVYRLLENQT